MKTTGNTSSASFPICHFLSQINAQLQVQHINDSESYVTLDPPTLTCSSCFSSMCFPVHLPSIIHSCLLLLYCLFSSAQFSLSFSLCPSSLCTNNRVCAFIHSMHAHTQTHTSSACVSHYYAGRRG